MFSIIGTVFTGKVAKKLVYEGYEAVIPLVQGSAHIVGRNEFFIDPSDDLKDGFLLR